MAIDTRQKRFSMLSFGDGNHWHATFEADSSVDLDDKQHLLDCYSGIAFQSLAGGMQLVNAGLIDAGLIDAGLVA